MDMKNLNIYDIKRLTAQTAPYFFDRKTLKFFNQRMADFRVKKFKELGLYHISCPIRDNYGKVIGRTVRYFNPVTNELEHVTNEY